MTSQLWRQKIQEIGEQIFNSPEVPKGVTRYVGPFTSRGFRRAIIVVVIGLIVLMVVYYAIPELIRIGHQLDWTGFIGGYIKKTETPQGITKEYPPGKTLWDWLQLLGVLAIPLAIAWFSYRQNRIQQRIASDRQQEDILEHYLDGMSDLLLGKNTGKDAPALVSPDRNDEITEVARARTLTVLRRLDGSRKGSVIRFLSESLSLPRFIHILDLDGINLDEADLGQMILSQPQMNLCQIKLRYSHLHGANLYCVNLSGADLSQCDLSRADLCGANLQVTDLHESCLRYARFGNAMPNPREKNLRPTDLRGANLCGADLRGTNLWKLIWWRSGVDLSGAKYNKVPIDMKDELGNPIKDELGNPIKIDRTRWPLGFDPKKVKELIPVDC